MVIYHPLLSHIIVCSNAGGSGGGGGSGESGGGSAIDMMNLMPTVSPPTSQQLQCISDEATNRALEITDACSSTDLADVSLTLHAQLLSCH